MSLKLVYFKMRALAEAPRLLMHYTELDYDYIMSWDYYDKDWSEAKPLVPFRQLPMLVEDKNHQICQSITIITIIENIFNENQYSQSFIKFWISKIVYWDFPTIFFIILYSSCASWTVLMWKIFPPRKIN